MALYKTGGGGGKDYDSGNLIVETSSRITEYTFDSDYDLVLIVTGATGETGYVPTYNGVTYSWKLGNFGQAYKASAVIIQNVKANTKVTFSNTIRCNIYGYNYV